MMTPLKDVKIVDTYDNNVIECCLLNQGLGWKPVKEQVISADKIRIVFERIHVDQPVYHQIYRVPLFQRIPTSHYEAYGVDANHQEFIRGLLN
jgi:hypothetical protein